MEELETKPSSKCIICDNKWEDSDKRELSEHRVCSKCQTKHIDDESIPDIFVNLIGGPIDDDIAAYKYHKQYLFNNNDAELSDDDYTKINKQIKIDDILKNERKHNDKIDPSIYFYLILYSTFHKFIKSLLIYCDGLFGPRLMAVLLVDKEYGAEIAKILTAKQ